MTRSSVYARIVRALALLCLAVPARAAELRVLHRFSDTGNSTSSHYALGASPYGELVQASDGNFYGTTSTGGSGLCPNNSDGGTLGCGTVFRMTPKGVVTSLYSFPYDTATGTAPNGAFPRAGLIQARNGYLYGVAYDGGIEGGCGSLGCGTIFRISLSGSFTLLHQFCGEEGCVGVSEGSRPLAHLVQTTDGSLCGSTPEGGFENEGTLFCASTGGSVTTLYKFQYENGTDGYNPMGALLVGSDGRTLYGTTVFGGMNDSAGGGTVFAFKGGVLTILHDFDDYHSGAAGTYYEPMGALIFGADGKLYGTTSSGGDGGCIFSLNTDGTDFSVGYVFVVGSNVPQDPDTGLVLASNGLMYGTTLFGSIEHGFMQDSGVIFSYNPAHGAFKPLADFNGTVGSGTAAVLIEGADNYLYTTTLNYGGSNARGSDYGTVVKLVPALKN